MGDGQISRGDTVVKGNAKKVRRIGKDVIAGFAGKCRERWGGRGRDGGRQRRGVPWTFAALPEGERGDGEGRAGVRGH